MTASVPDPETVPRELRERDQWLMWDASADIPRRPHWRGNFGVSWSDPDDWHSFEEAVEAAAERDSWGIGYVFARTNDDYPRGLYGCLDLDGCLRDDGGPRDWLPGLDWVLEAGGYVERSPSDTGLHIPLVGFKPPEWWQDSTLNGEEHAGVEAYGSKFVTVTGDVLDGGDEHPALDTVAEVDAAGFLADAYEVLNGEPPAHQQPNAPGSSGAATTDVSINIHDVISRRDHPTGENSPHPFHSSGTGANFRVWDDGSWTCWRHGTGGYGAHLVGVEQGVIECADCDGTLDTETWRDVFDAGREAGYNIPAKRSGHQRASIGESGATDPVPPGQTGDSGGEDTLADGGDALTPTAVVAAAGLGEDASPGELTDRQKAAVVWELVERSDEVHIRVRRDNGSLWSCDGGVWHPEGERALRHAARKALTPMNYGPKVLRIIKEQARSDPRTEVEHMGAPAGTVAVENGLLDLGTRDLRELRPDDHALFRVAAEYDPDAECPAWREFVTEVVRPADADALQEYAGYTLHHWGQPHKRAMLLLGPQDSGKSTFLNVLKAILGGRENVSSENLNSLVNTRWGTAKLHGKAANISNELETRKLESIGLFKTLTGGGDLISAEEKGTDKFEFEPTAKHLFAANQVPPANDADDAFYSRWLFATFPESVPASQQVRSLDKQLLADERAGILNWMLDGYDRLREQGGFTGDGMVGEKRERWEAYGNSVKRFKHNCLEVTGDADDVVAKEVAHTLYARYCREKAGTEVESQTKLTRELKTDENIGDGRRTLRPGGKRWHSYTGVRFKSEALDALDLDPGAKLADLRGDDHTETDGEDTRDAGLSGFSE